MLKQQGHLYGISTLDFSSDGQYIATGGDDSKVKLWNSTSGFCFVTFSEHVAPVTGTDDTVIGYMVGQYSVISLVLCPFRSSCVQFHYRGTLHVNTRQRDSLEFEHYLDTLSHKI